MRRRSGTGCVEFAEGVMLLDHSSDTGYQPPLDVTEVDDSVRILLEMPGVPTDKVQVLVRGDRVEVIGEKLPDFPKGEISFLCLERGFGKFCRAFEVIGPVNLGMISARQKDGILTITIPKISERRGRQRRIPVVQE
ncbi:MAG: Hsp20/alpha crystallin family protein [Syntrophorhabdaceae bacterium]|nr:Hsp20/alpha crystallin family protein [Syntrophorhabdaceae bacterium]